MPRALRALTWLLAVTVTFGAAHAADPAAKEKRQPVRLPDDMALSDVEGPQLTAKAAVLLEFEDGTVLFARHPHDPRPPASLTKMLSALLIVESGRLDDEVTVSERAAAIGESSISLSAGETLSLRDLLDASLIKSANDATAAAAEHVAGSLDAFVEQMNEKARELGAADSHLVNPHGLHDPDHVASAMDMAIIARHCMMDPLIREIVATRRKTLPWPGHEWDRVLINRNRLLEKYEYADGVKTGYTRHAGKCLAASATKEGRRLIGVVLDCEDAWVDAEEVVEWGFGNYRRVQAIAEGETFSLSVARGVRPTVTAEAASDVEFVIPVDASVARPEMSVLVGGAPIAQGDAVGAATVEVTDGQSAKVDLLAVEDLPERWVFRAVRALEAHVVFIVVVGLLLIGVLLGVKAYGASAKVPRERGRRLPPRVRGPGSSRARSGERRDGDEAGHPRGSGPRSGQSRRS